MLYELSPIQLPSCKVFLELNFTTFHIGCFPVLKIRFYRSIQQPVFRDGPELLLVLNEINLSWQKICFLPRYLSTKFYSE